VRVGTKSLLFGVHQAFLHPVFVLAAWIRLYGFPSPRELFCILIHDWGYWGKPNMDGEEGDRHPEWGAGVAGRLLGEDYKNLILGHSRFYHHKFGTPISRLYYADKYSHCLEPWWLYLPLAFASGEYYEYRKLHNADEEGFSESKYKGRMGHSFSKDDSPREWYRKIQMVMRDLTEGKYP
jgi:hypothetical protein